eukprot:NODE_1350_length_895_cov_89.187500_g1304_i0.p1 GENE.NODE_1350_length_895_cov_89.187500_g1304_i0~~NODE_1350_length_895_cov_89.187500_g1304_i0.p1  ORF type:complete len:250 (+),score=58.18 NODE_1350_length_895_cov_89.187500_g1304_i0:85-834(+)
MSRQFFVGGNWKLNPANLKAVDDLVKLLNEGSWASNVSVVVAPSSIHLGHVRASVKKEVGVSAQNCYIKASGAFTGETSADALKDMNIDYVILGHSERRNIFKETSELVAEKTAYALGVGLSVILCCGEHLSDREAGKTTEVVDSQLEAVRAKINDWSRVVIAYEPVWAIGTGKVATPEQAQEVHAHIRNWLREKVSADAASKTRIIYGGSVNGNNCNDLASKPDVDGFLVGGASLKPEFVSTIANAKF